MKQAEKSEKRHKISVSFVHNAIIKYNYKIVLHNTIDYDIIHITKAGYLLERPNTTGENEVKIYDRRFAKL